MDDMTIALAESFTTSSGHSSSGKMAGGTTRGITASRPGVFLCTPVGSIGLDNC
jgi:hypothetical protein